MLSAPPSAELPVESNVSYTLTRTIHASHIAVRLCPTHRSSRMTSRQPCASDRPAQGRCLSRPCVFSSLPRFCRPIIASSSPNTITNTLFMPRQSVAFPAQYTISTFDRGRLRYCQACCPHPTRPHRFYDPCIWKDPYRLVRTSHR